MTDKKSNLVFNACYKRENFIIYLMLLFFFVTLSSNAQKYTNACLDSRVKTVKLHKEGWALSNPIIELGSGQNLELSFDILETDTRSLNYSVELCDADWQPSVLMESEYLTGINQNPILDYDFSFNTMVSYVHYHATFPNNQFKLNNSGNYVVKVYENFDTDKPIIIWRFMVIEQLVSITPRIKYAINSELRKSMQEVDLTIDHPSFKISNPLSQIKVDILQNFRYDNALLNIKPQFVRNNSLEYNYHREMMFEGGNEYRWLDLRSTRFESSNIADIRFIDPYYHVELRPDKPGSEGRYFYHEDFNGKYVIEVQEGRDDEIEAEYLMVYFFLYKPSEIMGGDVFLMGGLVDGAPNSAKKMVYNEITRCYEVRVLLKQGFYNYMYAFVGSNSTERKLAPTEGSFGEAENDYQVVVYYRGFGDKYDRIIGLQQTNSIKTQTRQ